MVDEFRGHAGCASGTGSADEQPLGADCRGQCRRLAGAGTDRRCRPPATSVGCGFRITEQAQLHRLPDSRGGRTDAVDDIDIVFRRCGRRLRAGHAATIADLQAVEADWRAARLSLVAQTLRAYFGVVEAQRQVNLAEATVQSYDLSNRQVQSRYERGLRPTLDLLLSRASLSSAESVMHQRRLQLDVAVRQREVLVGRYPAGRLRTSTRLPGVPSPIPAGLPAELIGRRPDLAAAQRRLAASDARVAEARRNLYPRIGLTASGGRSSEGLGDLLDGDFGVWNLVGNLTQPLFQGGRLRAGIDLAEAHAERAVVGYAQAALRAFAEVESGLAAEGLLANQESALTAASRESTDARILAEQRYAKGLTDLLTLLTSQRASFDAESRLLAVQRQRLETRIDLHLALGGGFTLDAGTISATEETQ